MSVFETKRLIIREIKADDFTDLLKLFRQSVAMTFYSDEQLTDKVHYWIQSMRESYKKNRYGIWICQRRKTGQFIGQCGFQKKVIYNEEYAELGVSILKVFWNNGYATEAIKSCIAYGFNTLCLDRILTIVDDYNIAALRLVEKTGFTQLQTKLTDQEKVKIFELKNNKIHPVR